MPVKCSELIKLIEKKYPLELAEDYDNSGFIIGDYNKTINNILVCLDVNNEVIREAIENNIDIIISHHPIIFNPVKQLIKQDYSSSMIFELIKNDINVYAMHTNFDNAVDGINDVLTNLLELSDVKPLVKNYNVKLYKLAVFVPVSQHSTVLDTMLNAGAGFIGNYSHCSFNTMGEGTFLPKEGTFPFIGEVGKFEHVKEIKIETIVRKNDLDRVINEMLRVHPYEEAAYDIYPLDNIIENGTGRYGKLKNPMSFTKFCEFVKEKLSISVLNTAGDFNKEITTAAIVGGAGADFINDCIGRGCDVLITGDVKHHEALDAIHSGLNIIDAGHYSTEVLALPFICEFINSIFDVNCIITKINTNPFRSI